MSKASRRKQGKQTGSIAPRIVSNEPLWAVADASYTFSASDVINIVDQLRERLAAIKSLRHKSGPRSRTDVGLTQVTSPYSAVLAQRQFLINAAAEIIESLGILQSKGEATLVEVSIRDRLQGITGFVSTNQAFLKEFRATPPYERQRRYPEAAHALVRKLELEDPEFTRRNAGWWAEALSNLLEARLFDVSVETAQQTLPEPQFGVRLPFRSVLVLLRTSIEIGDVLERDDIAKLHKQFRKEGHPMYSQKFATGVLLHADEQYQIVDPLYVVGYGLDAQGAPDPKMWGAPRHKIAPLFPDLNQLVDHVIVLLSEGRWINGITDPSYRIATSPGHKGTTSEDALVYSSSYGIARASSKAEWLEREQLNFNYEVPGFRRRYRIRNRDKHIESGQLTSSELEQGWHYEWRDIDPYVVGDPELARQRITERAIRGPQSSSSLVDGLSQGSETQGTGLQL